MAATSEEDNFFGKHSGLRLVHRQAPGPHGSAHGRRRDRARWPRVPDRRAIKRLAPLALLLLLWPCETWAHSPIRGVGTFYAGFLHPLLIPAHLLALVALGLWLAQQQPGGRRVAIAGFALALLPALALAPQLDGIWQGLLVLLAALLTGALALVPQS